MKKILIVSSLVLAMCACNKTELNNTNEGYGDLQVSVNLEPQTKAAMSADELLNTASVKIYKANHKGMVRSYAYSEMPSKIHLTSDAYRVDIVAGDYVNFCNNFLQNIKDFAKICRKH